MGLRTNLCFILSRRLMRPPVERTANYSAYADWRSESLSASCENFDNDYFIQKELLDFGCGDGQLSLFIAKEKNPKKIVGVDISEPALERARAMVEAADGSDGVAVEFVTSTTESLPLPSQAFDTIVAFDCLEHVMAPERVVHEWFRVLRPGGSCLIEWFPYKGPFGPHMEALVPIPWAHVVFGERAMFRAAEAIYDLPDFVPRHWDLDEHGTKKPNKWKAWSSFEEQGYINKLDIPRFRRMAVTAGFTIQRLEKRSFGGSPLRRAVSTALKRLPVAGEYFVSFVIIELRRPG